MSSVDIATRAAMTPIYPWLTTISVPALVREGLRTLGTREVAGAQHNPVILGWAHEVGLHETYVADETPWCGLWMAVIAQRADWPPVAAPLWARNWAKFGDKSPEPSLGDVLVFSRANGVFTAPPAPVAPVVQTTPYMSHFGFLLRFTPQQRLAIRERTDKASPSYDATLDDAMFLFNSAERIDVSLPMTQQLVGYMAMTGLITEAEIPSRLAEIDITSPHAKP